MLFSSTVSAMNSGQLLEGVNSSIVVDLHIAGKGSSNERYENENPHIVNLGSSGWANVSLIQTESQKPNGNRWVVTSSALDA
jgi:hypothetical protein